MYLSRLNKPILSTSSDNFKTWSRDAEETSRIYEFLIVVAGGKFLTFYCKMNVQYKTKTRWWGWGLGDDFSYNTELMWWTVIWMMETTQAEVLVVVRLLPTAYDEWTKKNDEIILW